jgi:hypothetical protein
MKQKLKELKGQRDKCTVTAGVFNTPLSVPDRNIRLKINKDRREQTRGYNTHLHNSPPNSSINILIKYPWSIYQD